MIVAESRATEVLALSYDWTGGIASRRAGGETRCGRRKAGARLGGPLCRTHRTWRLAWWRRLQGKRMVAIVALDDDTTDATLGAIERIFFASAGRTAFADAAERNAFRERWLGRYLEHDRAHVFLAREPGGAVAGYLVGCLEDPARTERFSDITFYPGFADLTVRYPAHLHINLDPEWRSQGIGARLIDAFVQQAARAGAAGMHVVTAGAARNVGFYRRCRFVPLREAQWNGNTVLLLGRDLVAEPHLA